MVVANANQHPHVTLIPPCTFLRFFASLIYSIIPVLPLLLYSCILCVSTLEQTQKMCTLKAKVVVVVLNNDQPAARNNRLLPPLDRVRRQRPTNGGDDSMEMLAMRYDVSSLIVDAPGSIAAVRREEMAYLQAQRKMKIAHYGRSKSAKFESNNMIVPLVLIDSSSSNVSSSPLDHDHDQKRCSFITTNSDPVYVAYHDEEWGVPVHDDNMLFELLVLSGAQVGSDWTSIMYKRKDLRNAFHGFNAETVAIFTEKQIISVSTEYAIDISRVRGVVDNSNRILEIKKTFGSFDKYIWGFVNNKPISTQYKTCLKIPVKTSKSESISKDMVRRGFRFVGPTVIYSFMQASGLTNDHLVTCYRHLQCKTSL